MYKVLGQIDPGPIEDDVIAKERERFPNWESDDLLRSPSYWERCRGEWNRADAIVVNSRWSKQCLVEIGVAADRIGIIPLAYEVPSGASRALTQPRRRRFVVLWLGTVCLRKGFPYFRNAAERLRSTGIEFRVVGELRISNDIVRSSPPNLSFVGPTTRASISDYYSQASVFVLPTMSDGFAITQLEAMAHGVPVIATSRCGDVVRNGIDGVLVAAGSGEEVAEAILTVYRDEEYAEYLRANARARVLDFSLSRYGTSLDRIACRVAPERCATSGQGVAIPNE